MYCLYQRFTLKRQERSNKSTTLMPLWGEEIEIEPT